MLITLLSTALTSLLVLGTQVATSGAPAASRPAGADRVVVLPMHTVARSGVAGALAPTVVAPASCGTAFLYLSGDDGEVTLTYGFKYLSFPAIGYSADASGTNTTDGSRFGDHASRTLVLRRSFTRQATVATSAGSVEVTAQVKAFGPFRDCVSGALTEDVEVS